MKEDVDQSAHVLFSSDGARQWPKTETGILEAKKQARRFQPRRKTTPPIAREIIVICYTNHLSHHSFAVHCKLGSAPRPRPPCASQARTQALLVHRIKTPSAGRGRIKTSLMMESSKPDSFSTPSNLRHQSQAILSIAPSCATDVVRTWPSPLMNKFSWIAAPLIGDQTVLSKCQTQQFRMGL